MDDMVRLAMARWPNVPAVYGWLRLDGRGRWLIKDQPIGNAIVSAFISRNYLCDDQGRWYFQNGPQQVFVALDYTPFVYRVWQNADGTLAAEAHTGTPLQGPDRCWMDEHGTVLLACGQCIGSVDDQSLVALAQALIGADGKPLDEDGLNHLIGKDGTSAIGATLAWNGRHILIERIARHDVPARFGFDPAPQPPVDLAAC
jgi:Protein of unknown function (DUF2946)